MPYWTVPWQLPATPLQRYVAAPLPCHASDGVHELRRWQRQQPPVAKPPVENTGDVTGAVYLLLPKYTSIQVQTMVMG